MGIDEDLVGVVLAERRIPQDADDAAARVADDAHTECDGYTADGAVRDVLLAVQESDDEGVDDAQQGNHASDRDDGVARRLLDPSRLPADDDQHDQAHGLDHSGQQELFCYSHS